MDGELERAQTRLIELVEHESKARASELERVWEASWLYAGPSAAVREAGDYFRFELADWSLVIVRGEDGRVHALHNTCRHRGMPFCSDAVRCVSTMRFCRASI